MNSRRTERNAAITPLTCGAAMLVPLAAAIALSLSAGALRVGRALRTVEPTRSEPA